MANRWVDCGGSGFCPTDGAVGLLAIAGFLFLALVLYLCVSDVLAHVRENRRLERLRRLTGNGP